MRGWMARNALSLVLFGAFLLFVVLQSVFSWQADNQELTEHGQATRGYLSYLASGEFVEATFENWESEFLQMAAYVVLTALLVQRGSPESRAPHDPGSEVGRAVTPDSPAVVRRHRRGAVRRLYDNSLSLALFGLFLLSFVLHLLGGTAAYNDRQALHGQPPISPLHFLLSSDFWFQSMQNWQSEFLAVGTLVVLSIFLRQRGSSQSKEVSAPNSETGD